MRIYVITDTYAGSPVEVFDHYVHASEMLELAEENGSAPNQYRIDGPFEITIGFVSKAAEARICTCNAPDGLRHVEGCPLAGDKD